MMEPRWLRCSLRMLLSGLAGAALALAAGCSSSTAQAPQTPPAQHGSASAATQTAPGKPPASAGAKDPLPMDAYGSAVAPRWLVDRPPLQHPAFTPHWYTPKVDPLFRHRLGTPDDPPPPDPPEYDDDPPDESPPDNSAPAPASERLAALGGPDTRDEASAPHRHIKDYAAVVPLLHGIASWYGPGFHGKLTASGEVYNQNAMTAAHPTLPMGTVIRVKNERNGRVAWVRVNDRGPYKKGRVLDLSRAAARSLGMEDQGTAPVRITVMRWPRDTDTRLGLRAYSQYVVQVAAYPQPEKADAVLQHMRDRFAWARFRLDPRPGGELAVVSGPYDDNTAARQVARRLQQAGITSLVRRYRK